VLGDTAYCLEPLVLLHLYLAQLRSMHYFMYYIRLMRTALLAIAIYDLCFKL
jgi:hypothetical protein